MSMQTDEPPKLDDLIFGEIQVLLAEKRAALASLRTGIAVHSTPKPAPTMHHKRLMMQP